jgi:oligopeptide transport system substrate-binding protein
LPACTGAEVSAPEALRVGIPSPVSLDAAALKDESGRLLVRQIHETLVGFDPVSLALQARLVEAWEVGEDGRRHRFRIRSDATFHDGKPVRADDVLYSLNRLVSGPGGPGSGALLESVRGFDSVHTLGSAETLEGLTAIDDRTVEFSLTAPWFDFPYVLSHPATSIIPKGSDPSRRSPVGSGGPVGAGPYRLDEQPRLSAGMELRSIGGRGPQEVLFVFEDRASTAWGAFQAGRLDLVPAPVGELDDALETYGSGGFRPLAAMLYLGVNLRDPRFTDTALRKALSLALDREAISMDVYGGALVPARGIVPEGIPGGTPEVCDDLCGHDPGRASRAVSGLFGPGRPAFRYDYPAGAPNDDLALLIEELLEAAGMEVTLRPHDLTGYADFLASGRHELFQLGWVAEYPLADWFLRAPFLSSSPENYSGYRDESLDRRSSRARALPDRRARVAAYRAMEEQLMDEMVIIPIGQFMSHYVVGARVEGLAVDPLGGFRIEDLRLDES